MTTVTPFPTLAPHKLASALPALSCSPAPTPKQSATHPSSPTLPRNLTPPLTLDTLITQLHKELEHGGLSSSQVSVERVRNLMETYSSSAAEYLPFAHFDYSKPYTRNLVDDGNGFFNLIVLCWTPGRGSPIHDHPNSHCIMKVLEGSLTETQYDFPKPHHSDDDSRVDSGNEDGENEADDGLRLKKTTRLEKNSVAYISDKIGLHRVANSSTTRPAISLHLYTPPIEICKTYCERTGASRASGKCVFFRDFSKRNGVAAAVGGDEGVCCVEQAGGVAAAGGVAP
ncbi:RmlC-like cupin domain-containing protein [Fimicolochytrium jonesii]|uniref:RmlC-like cupin domain-containing protein n=1 Tax=Fimicolochytrium jonesii TaxID=1396493 RepID=UPI0022FE63FB|nr:RmlC-like cupin domain-containing protein [Fimicolochytrium jonesii]KAI8815914.1 RmlC-like cupin domain-containing protein [Fimicolochytrium jonesii]